MCHIQHCHSTRFDSTPFDKGMPGSHRMAVVETCQPGLHYAMGSRWRQWGHWAHDWFRARPCPDHPDRPSTGSKLRKRRAVGSWKSPSPSVNTPFPLTLSRYPLQSLLGASPGNPNSAVWILLFISFYLVRSPCSGSMMEFTWDNFCIVTPIQFPSLYLRRNARSL